MGGEKVPMLVDLMSMAADDPDAAYGQASQEVLKLINALTIQPDGWAPSAKEEMRSSALLSLGFMHGLFVRRRQSIQR